jgi:hypothetical protein
MVMDADEMFGNKKKKTKGSDASDPGPSPEEQAAAAARAAERAETCCGCAVRSPSRNPSLAPQPSATLSNTGD